MCLSHIQGTERQTRKFQGDVVKNTCFRAYSSTAGPCVGLSEHASSIRYAMSRERQGTRHALAVAKFGHGQNSASGQPRGGPASRFQTDGQHLPGGKFGPHCQFRPAHHPERARNFGFVNHP